MMALAAPALAGPAENAGEALVVAGAGSTQRLDKGGSATEFSIRLPVGASCPGDSATDGYRVQSYMSPLAVPPDAVQYDGLGPTPNAYGKYELFRQPLYDTATRPFASAFTAVAIAPGQPGPVVNIPSLSFAVYGPDELPPGRYHVGVACTLANQPVKYWDTEVTVAVASDDRPAGISWTLTGATRGRDTSSAGSVGLVIIVGSVALLAGGVVYARRRPRPRDLPDFPEAT